MNKELEKKYGRVKKILKGFDKAIIAFSGGIDSTLVLKAAYDALGENAIAVTADSPSLPRRELEEAKKIADEIGVKHVIINTDETKNEKYLENPSDRCYHCKSELYSKLKIAAAQLEINNILNGTNFDDLQDYRPGLKAADEFRITSPLKDAGMTKEDVRAVAKHLQLRAWDKPSSPCLSSRIPYGQRIDMKKLSMIENAENFLKDLGIKELRVRHFGETARIEVKESDKPAIDGNLHAIRKKFSEIGFSRIAVSEFKSGSLNVVLNV